jgi:hypothetical protein
MYRLHLQGENKQPIPRRVPQLPATANVLSLLIIFTLKIETIRFGETSVLKKAMRRNIPEDGRSQVPVGPNGIQVQVQSLLKIT